MCTNCLYSKKQQDIEKEISKDTLKNIKNGEKRCLKETIIFVKCVENQAPTSYIIKYVLETVMMIKVLFMMWKTEFACAKDVIK